MGEDDTPGFADSTSCVQDHCITFLQNKIINRILKNRMKFKRPNIFNNNNDDINPIVIILIQYFFNSLESVYFNRNYYLKNQK